ncbi:benzoate 4-monooxygenase cytochrome P450 [Xylariaceae sp. FL0662B]|nr:benzoate 4-monooxygenase cytochrome P450 [Xylariaceae sp. FL0662B]
MNLLLLIGAYRLLLHPLRDYPGPLLAKLSDCYGGFFAFRRNLHLRTWKDHKRYGPVLRQGPDKLVFSTVDALRDIYQNEHIVKSRCYQSGNNDPNATNVFNTIDKRVHRIKRQRIGQLLAEQSLRKFEPIIAQEVDIFVGQLLSACDSQAIVNMSERCKYLGLDIAALLSFGYPLRLQTERMNRHLVTSVARGSWITNMHMQFAFLKTIHFAVPFYLLAKLRGEAFLQTLRRMITARLSEDKHARHDLYSHLADALQAEEDRITMGEIWSEAIFFLPAAGDTSATALSALFFYLAHNSRCQQELSREIRSTFTSSDEICSGPKLAGCKYLRACINEALRMSPPVAGTLWREQLDTSRQFVVDGHLIPKGVQVGVNVYAIHHHEKYFPDPFQYKPERWISSSSENESQASNTAAFVPFSTGSRACGGKAMAYQEVSLTMAKTLWHLDFRLAVPGGLKEATPGEAEFQLQDVFTSAHDGP